MSVTVYLYGCSKLTTFPVALTISNVIGSVIIITVVEHYFSEYSLYACNIVI